jgi:hypothetical protein
VIISGFVHMVRREEATRHDKNNKGRSSDGGDGYVFALWFHRSGNLVRFGGN